MPKQTMTGIISQVSEKDWKGDGSVMLYSFQIEGSNRWFRTGTNQVPVGAGTAVRFLLDGQNVDASSIEAIDAGEVQVAPAPKAPTGSGTGFQKKSGGGENFAARQKYWDNKEVRDVKLTQPNIEIQAARRDAITLVDVLLREGALPDFGKATAAKKMDVVVAAIDELTETFVGKLIKAEDVLNNE